MARRAAKASRPEVALITTCKGRLLHLKETLPLALEQPFAEVIVVDYDCPEKAGDWVEAHHPGAKVVRSGGPRPEFSPAIARNLGAAATGAPYLFFMDADVRLAPSFAETMFGNVAPGRYLISEPMQPELCGTILVAHADFDRVGGYDEVMIGWGCEDIELWDRLDLAGVRKGGYDAGLATPIEHSNDLRMAHHADPSLVGSGLINLVYRSMKSDLARLGRPLDLTGRRMIYDQIRASAVGGQPAASYDVPFASFGQHGFVLTSRLKYELKPPEGPAQAPSASASAPKSSTR